MIRCSGIIWRKVLKQNAAACYILPQSHSCRIARTLTCGQPSSFSLSQWQVFLYSDCGHSPWPAALRNVQWNIFRRSKRVGLSSFLGVHLWRTKINQLKIRKVFSSKSWFKHKKKKKNSWVFSVRTNAVYCVSYCSLIILPKEESVMI